MNGETMDQKNVDKETLNDDLDYLLNGEKRAAKNKQLEALGERSVGINRSGGIDSIQGEKLDNIKFSVKEERLIRNLVTAEEVKRDIDEILLSSEDDVEKKVVKPRSKRKEKTKVTRERSPKVTGDKSTKLGASEENSKKKASKQGNQKKLDEKKPKKEDVPGEKEPSETKEPNGTDNNNDPKKNKKKRRQRKQKKSADNAGDDSEKPTPATEIQSEPDDPKRDFKKEPKPDSKNGPKPENNKSKSPEISADQQSEAPFNIKLKSVKSAHANKKYSERLPQIHPVETIMGMSNEQIFRLKSSDIKLKSIITQADKSLKTIIDFAMENEEMFKDENIRTIFVDLCINIALYESRGLNKTFKRYPNVLELFSGFEALTLDFNNTDFTKSDRKIHQNNFDYSILSYIGNIIIWIQHINSLSYVPKKLVRQSFGGYYLWDQLFKEDSINMKRWKHIIKFRENFPFQINQFIVIMKFLHVDIYPTA